MAAALPFIQAAVGAVSLYNGIKQATAPTPQAPPVLSMQQATQQAKQALNPIYDNQIADSMHNLDNQLIRRGFFGQLPGAALQHANQGELENQRAAAIANLAAQLQGQSFGQAATAAQLAQQQARTALQIPGQINQAAQGFRDTFPTTWQNLFGNDPSNTISAAGNVAGQGTNPLSTQPLAHPSTPTFQLDASLSNPYASRTLY